MREPSHSARLTAKKLRDGIFFCTIHHKDMKRLSLVRRWVGIASLFGALIVFVILRIFVLPKHVAKDTAELPQEVRKALAQQADVPAGTPWMERIEDADVRRAIQPDFYHDAAGGDLVVHFPDRVVLYRPRTKTILAQFFVATSTP